MSPRKDCDYLNEEFVRLGSLKDYIAEEFVRFHECITHLESSVFHLQSMVKSIVIPALPLTTVPATIASPSSPPPLGK